MEYAYNDFCISTLAEALGKPENVVNKYRDRAFNYKNVFDPSINFVRPKDDKGNWESPYRPDTWGGSFTEGSAWHWTWSVFQDPAGLANLMGGKETFIKMLDSVFVASPTFDYSNYNKVIHEMKEMVSCNMGQYAHGNQPIQHAIYLYNYMGQPWKTQKWVRHTMSNLYSSGIEDGKGLCGDEDNGQTSAWFVFSSTGFYPVCPGTNQYIIGAPLFKQTKMKLPNGKTFTVKAPENSETNIYIQSATLNGKVFDKPFITHGEILNGGVMEFVMGPEPNKNWGTSVKPFSLSELN
jgi:predicted alpha-1,2-mannosidase